MERSRHWPDLRSPIYGKSGKYKLDVLMQSCNPPSLKPFRQTLRAGHAWKLILRKGQLTWTGDLTWSDLGSSTSHIVQNWCATRYAKRRGAKRLVFFLHAKKKQEGGNMRPLPALRGEGLTRTPLVEAESAPPSRFSWKASKHVKPATWNLRYLFVPTSIGHIPWK